MLVDELSLVPDQSGPQPGFHLTRPAHIVIHPHCRAFVPGAMKQWERIGTPKATSGKGVFARAVRFFFDVL